MLREAFRHLLIVNRLSLQKINAQTAESVIGNPEYAGKDIFSFYMPIPDLNK
jgi:hypothetical protein